MKEEKKVKPTTPKKKPTTTKKTTTTAKKTVKKPTEKKTAPKKVVTEVKEEVIEIRVNEEAQKSKSLFKDSLFPVLLFSFLTSLIAIFIAYSQSKVANSYYFSGFNEYVTVNSGLISANGKVNSFEGNNIAFSGKEDILVTEYKFGYYVKEGDFKTNVISSEKKFLTPSSLKNEVNSIVGFNFVETANVKGGYLDKEALGLIEEGKLYFFIDYKTHDKQGNLVSETIELKLKVLKN